MKSFGTLPKRPVACQNLFSRTYPWPPALHKSYFSSSSRLDKPKTGQFRKRKSKDPAPASVKALEDGFLQVDVPSKTIGTSSGSLPVSPLMDPDYLAAKKRHQHHKPRQSELPEKRTKFQNRLMRNPYAHALASTLRPCAATKATLPRFFLLGFNLIAHPTTGEPYWVNEELRKPHNMLSAPKSNAEPVGRAWEGGESPEEEPDDDNSGLPPRKRGPSAWVLARQDLLELFPDRDRKLPYSQMHKGFLRMNVSDGSNRLNQALNSAVWREDMDVLLLELARRRIVDALISFARGCTEYGRQYITQVQKYEDAKEHKHRGCLLWFGEPQQQQQQQQQQPKERERERERERREGREMGQKEDDQDSGQKEPKEKPAVRSSSEPADGLEPVETPFPPSNISHERPEGGWTTPPVPEAPAQLSIMDIEGPWDRKLAVHNMDILLGETHVARLRRDSPLFKTGSLFLLGRFATLDLVMRLWKLQGYIKPALHHSSQTQTPPDAP